MSTKPNRKVPLFEIFNSENRIKELIFDDNKCHVNFTYERAQKDSEHDQIVLSVLTYNPKHNEYMLLCNKTIIIATAQNVDMQNLISAF